MGEAKVFGTNISPDMSAGFEVFANDEKKRPSLNIQNSLPMIDENAIDDESLTSEAAEM